MKDKTGGKRMRKLLASGKVEIRRGGVVLDVYNQQVKHGICPTICRGIDYNNGIYYIDTKHMEETKSYIHTAPNGERYRVRIRKFTPRDCFRLMGVRDADIDKLTATRLVTKNKTVTDDDGKKRKVQVTQEEQIISNCNLYKMAGNSIVTNCMTEMFDKLFFPQENDTYVDEEGQMYLF